MIKLNGFSKSIISHYIYERAVPSNMLMFEMNLEPSIWTDGMSNCNRHIYETLF